jgi:hypothetical protein
MTKSLLILALGALALAAAAQAKGPSAAAITGPGLDEPLLVTGLGDESGLVGQTGFFAATFGQSPDPMLPSRPTGDLGPRYTIRYTVPGPNNTNSIIRQDVYPYADDGPVLYMKPGQPFFETERTHGGWFQAAPQLKQMLVGYGLSTAETTSTSRKGSIAGIAAGAFVVGTAGLVLVRRRFRH